MLIVKKISDLVYGIQRSAKTDIKYVHHDQLKLRVKLDDWTVSSAADVVVELSDGVFGVDEKDSKGKVDVGLDSEQLNDDLKDVSLHQENVPYDNVSFSGTADESAELLREDSGKTLFSDSYQSKISSDASSIPNTVENDQVDVSVMRSGRRVKPPV